jgi:hypothetical protein
VPSLTSVIVGYDTRLCDVQRLCDIQRDLPLFLDASGTDISTYLDDNQSRLAETHHTFTFISNPEFIPSFISDSIIQLSQSHSSARHLAVSL